MEFTTSVAKVTVAYQYNPGDHGYIDRIFYKHHFIVRKVSYDSIAVIEFTGTPTDMEQAQIEEATYDNLSDSHNTFYKISYDNCYPPDVTLQVANIFLKNNTMLGCYNLIANNCEHFSSFCKTGTGRSFQVRRVFGGVSGAFVGATLGDQLYTALTQSKDNDESKNGCKGSRALSSTAIERTRGGRSEDVDLGKAVFTGVGVLLGGLLGADIAENVEMDTELSTISLSNHQAKYRGKTFIEVRNNKHVYEYDFK